MTQQYLWSIFPLLASIITCFTTLVPPAGSCEMQTRLHAAALFYNIATDQQLNWRLISIISIIKDCPHHLLFQRFHDLQMSYILYSNSSQCWWAFRF